MIERTTDRERIEALVQSLREKGTRVVAPVRAGRRVLFGALGAAAHIAWEMNGDPVPRNSPKAALFPATEPVLRWRQRGSDVVLESADGEGVSPTVLLGARPCDARGVKTLDALFGWDDQDSFWQDRRAATTIVTIACAEPDAHCFCTAVGGAPDSAVGSDVLLVPVGDGRYHVEAVSERGEAFVVEHPETFAEPTTGEERRDVATRAREAMVPTPEADDTRAWMREHFEDEFWGEAGLPCLGCGACAAVCPTCHCFDIVDEHESFDCGERRKNWDSCGFSLFTLHASGHNPRPEQWRRLRQRVFHKFVYYFDRFGENLCTGCGRCGRSCLVGIDMAAIVRKVGEKAGQRG